MDKQFNVAIAKTDEQERTATGLVFAPLTIDSQGDFMSAPDIKAASERFMKSGRTRNIDVNHSGVAVDAFVAENLISKGDDGFPEGSWIVTTKIEDDAVWNGVRAGELTGFSMMGNGTRNVAKLNGKEAKRITDLDVHAISLVSKAANREEFSVIKNDDPMQYIAKQFEELAKHMAATNESIKAIKAQQTTLDQQLASLGTSADGRVVRKAAPVRSRTDERIDYQLRKMDRLQSKLDQVWERPDLNSDETESDLRRGIAKCQDELYALGHSIPRAHLDSNSAFLQRGGTSNFLVASASSLDDILGVGHHTRRLRKSDEHIEVENCLVL